ncbi:MAG TPA: leucine-rich repeat domain-containing protein, partial [Spirochaetes bacterium]|nr:leucine-rich repeat domain-containing protein [Spirochaetota bacterium]
LTSLDLGDNQLRTVPKVLGNLKALTWLGLSKNQLRTVPKELGNLKALTELYLKGNPISDKEKQKIKKLLPKCKVSF